MRRVCVTLSGLVVSAIALLVQAAPTTKPSAPTTKPAGARLFAPYSKMSSLTDEQREKIHEIHRKYLDDLHDLERKQTDEIAAMLNEDQKRELREIEEKAATDAKTRSAAKKDTAASDATAEK